MRPSRRPPLTLAVHPTSKGCGWVAFEGPLAPYDWGLFEAKQDKNLACMKKIESLIERLAPETLVLEAFDQRVAIRSERVARLCRSLIALADVRNVDVAIYTRADVRTAFAQVGAHTRQEIAEAVARHVDAFRHRLPKARKPWQAEDPRMALFSAAALALTHFQRSATDLLDDMSVLGSSP